LSWFASTCTRPVGEEPVDEPLGQSPVDLRRVSRCPLAPVRARVIDVCVEPVLMAGVPDGPEPGAKVAAARAAQVADRHTRRARMRPAIPARDSDQHPH
jgi:hypothetical protein